MEISHLTAAARDSERLVLDDRDRVDLLRRLAAGLGAGKVLAYCVLDTHVHVVVDRPAHVARERGRNAVLGYAQAFNARHHRSGGLLRGPVEATTARSGRELARQIFYVHANPVRTNTPIVAEAFHFELSSARAFAGLSLAPWTNVERALALLGKERSWIGRRGHPLEGLEPAPFPAEGVDLVLAAAAQTFGVSAVELIGAGRSPEIMAARAVYAHLGRLEGFDDAHLAAALGKTRRRLCQVVAGPVNPVGVRVGRTLLRVPALRARLRPGAAVGPPLHFLR